MNQHNILLVCAKEIALLTTPSQLWTSLTLFSRSYPVFPLVRADIVPSWPSHHRCIQFISEYL